MIAESLVIAFTTMARAFMHKIDDEQIDALAAALNDLPTDAVCDACVEITRHERFFPRPVVIRSYVDRLARQRQHTQHTPAAAFIDPTTGDRCEWTCLACQDRGLRPHNDDGHVISWDQARGVGAYQFAGPVHVHHVSRCTICNRIAAPKPKHTRATFDQEQADKATRGSGWSRFNA